MVIRNDVVDLDDDYDDAYDDEREAHEAAMAAAMQAPVFSMDQPRRWVMIWLMLALPMFGQSFHYIRGLTPLWAFSKAFPLLSLPLVFMLGHYSRFPMSRQVMLTFIWLVLSPTFAAIFYFHQPFFTGITAQVKLMPMLYFFSFLVFLMQVKPTMNELARAYIIMGVGTMVLLVIFLLVIPDAWYIIPYSPDTNPIFSNDDRGHRIRMPAYFLVVTLFFCFRRFARERQLRYLVATVAAIAIAVFIIKTRAWIIGITGVLLLNTFVWSKPIYKIGLLVIGPFVLIGVFSFGYLATTFDFSANSGFDTRWITIVKASEFLGFSPARWILGVGTISPTNSDTLMAYFDHFFFLADITWLGIIFEYGLVGAAMFLLLQVRGMLAYNKLRQRVDDDFLGALYDYIIYSVMISNLYPLTLVPGETLIICSIFVYIWHMGFTETADADVEAPI